MPWSMEPGLHAFETELEPQPIDGLKEPRPVGAPVTVVSHEEARGLGLDELERNAAPMARVERTRNPCSFLDAPRTKKSPGCDHGLVLERTTQKRIEARYSGPRGTRGEAARGVRGRRDRVGRTGTRPRRTTAQPPAVDDGTPPRMEIRSPGSPMTRLRRSLAGSRRQSPRRERRWSGAGESPCPYARVRPAEVFGLERREHRCVRTTGTVAQRRHRTPGDSDGRGTTAARTRTSRPARGGREPRRAAGAGSAPRPRMRDRAKPKSSLYDARDGDDAASPVPVNRSEIADERIASAAGTTTTQNTRAPQRVSGSLSKASTDCNRRRTRVLVDCTYRNTASRYSAAHRLLVASAFPK